MSTAEQSYVAGQCVDTVVLQGVSNVSVLHGVLEFHL